MNKQIGRMVALFVCAAVPLCSACQKRSTTQHAVHPAQVEHIEGSDIARVTLTAKAMERIDLQTATVEERKMSPTVKVVPYSALIYDAHGDTWVYTSPKPRTFVRHQVKVERIQGNDVILAEGPEVGTVVATVGVAELYGAEFGVGH